MPTSLSYWIKAVWQHATMESALTTYLTGPRGKIITAVLAVAAATAATPIIADTAEDQLSPVPRHEKIGQLVTEFIQKSHYRHASVDDDLSSMVLDRYIEALDNNRMYFLASDIAAFEQYRYLLDDMVRSEPLNPVFEMFDVYRTRVRQRLEFARTQLESEPDFSVDETYQFDREEIAWAASDDDLDELWRKRVKNDALSLALADKEWPDIQEVLEKRYATFAKRMDQIKSDDVFETFMNAFAHTLDPHSSYLSPRNSEEYRIQMSLSYFGIGASLQTEDDFVMVSNIIPGGPAAIDGALQPKDKITAVAQGDRRGIGGCNWLASRRCRAAHSRARRNCGPSAGNACRHPAWR